MKLASLEAMKYMALRCLKGIKKLPANWHEVARLARFYRRVLANNHRTESEKRFACFNSRVAYSFGKKQRMIAG